MSRKPLDPVVPAATRWSSPGWRDPRLWIGLALVTGSVVAGSQVLAAADDTTAVWAAGHELAQGQVLTESDLTPVRVRFAEEAVAGRYLLVTEAFPDDVTLSRPLGAGELLPRGAMGVADVEGVVSVSLALPSEEVPQDLEAGSRVDVWVVESRHRTDGERASVVLENVAVMAAPGVQASFGSTSGRQVVLAVPDDESEALSRVLTASRADGVRLVGRAR